MKKSIVVSVLTALAVAPILVGSASANTGCQVYSGGGWLGGACPEGTSISAERIEGKDRYETSALISSLNFTPGVEAVYLANGQTMADALAVGPVANGPILLVPAEGNLPDSVAEELRRLNPQKLVVLGGGLAVSDSIVTHALKASGQ